MIGSVSSLLSYVGYNSTTTATQRQQQFQKQLLAKLDTNGDGSISQDELKTAQSKDGDNKLLADLSQNFTSLDSDSSGGISLDELAALKRPEHGNRAPDTQLADALLKALDSNGDGTLSNDELATGLSNAGSNADSTSLFSALDKDSSGSLSVDELAAAFAPPAPPVQLSSSQLFSQLDTDGDGSISQAELASALQGSTDSSLNCAVTTDSTTTVSTGDTASALLLKALADASGTSTSTTQKAQDNIAEALSRLMVSLNTQYQNRNTVTATSSTAAAA
ncbi:EF-hand domain-containing protein [Pseudomonas fuscovaginae UPB0736]|uniref:XopAW family type III secretion system calcium-binding effector n=1 Tax=Pseudomonas asplenii TaxID=53407 RepID=UPI0002881EB2|nr:XopAW family type III secretion system calcium-binding effector [Pseudomonas fuscovaginae]UUQ66169.1 EF-hand domain-containing protein [Pseudomonas fuscovaginae UPB0736]